MSLFSNIAHAAEGQSLDQLMDKIYKVVLNPLITLFFVAALVLFLFGMVRFLTNRDTSSEEAKKGKQHMLWGIVGMFIMISVFGIMRLIVGTLGADVKV